ncbi:MAG: hypothetical protein J4G01_08635, partial [Dehalococcoidia bacterium]|nr:hypothetical protein [Dehalococcoidia bacterium]
MVLTISDSEPTPILEPTPQPTSTSIPLTTPGPTDTRTSISDATDAEGDAILNEPVWRGNADAVRALIAAGAVVYVR